MKNLLNHLIIIISIYILIFISIKYLSNKNNYITIKIIYNNACIVDKQIDFKLVSLIEDDIDVDYIKPHCKDGFRKNHRGFIISKDKLNTLLELTNEIDINNYAQQIIENEINTNTSILKNLNNNMVSQLNSLLEFKDSNLDMSNIISKIDKLIYKASRDVDELEFVKKNYKYLFKIIEISEQKKIRYFNSKMSVHLTFIFYPIILFLIFMFKNRAFGFVIK